MNSLKKLKMKKVKNLFSSKEDVSKVLLPLSRKPPKHLMNLPNQSRKSWKKPI